MLVFISDIHLTDGSSGETINPGAFEKFSDHIVEMVKKAEAQELEIVLLGDIFDVIRSDYWLSTNLRPWSENDGELRKITEDIIRRICEKSENIQSIQNLKKIREKLNWESYKIHFTYIIGNHDWLINRYDSTRKMISDFLGIEYNGYPFKEENLWEEYSVFARHGDKYDKFNHDGDRNASSLGDAIVIDLLNRFPKAVEDRLFAKGIKNLDLVKGLKEIDNVRPLVDIPLWIMGVCNKTGDPHISDEIKKVWNDLVDEFLDIDFVKNHDSWNPFDMVDALELGLRVSKFTTFENLTQIPLRKFQNVNEDYKEYAYNELVSKTNEAEFILYGHTHGHTLEPLDLIRLKKETLMKSYINTGTWRKVHVKTEFDKKNFEFMSWHVMTFVAFYKDGERKDKKFEIWNGALG